MSVREVGWPRPDPSWLRAAGLAGQVTSPRVSGDRGGMWQVLSTPAGAAWKPPSRKGAAVVLAGDIQHWVADHALGEGCGSGPGGPALCPLPHPQPPRGAVPSRSPKNAA